MGIVSNYTVSNNKMCYSIKFFLIRNQNKLTPTGGLTTIGRRSGQAVTGGENRFIFKRRLFKSTRELSQDPVEISLLYSQAVHSIVKVYI